MYVSTTLKYITQGLNLHHMYMLVVLTIEVLLEYFIANIILL